MYLSVCLSITSYVMPWCHCEFDSKYYESYALSIISCCVGHAVVCGAVLGPESSHELGQAHDNGFMAWLALLKAKARPLCCTFSVSYMSINSTVSIKNITWTSIFKLERCSVVHTAHSIIIIHDCCQQQQHWEIQMSTHTATIRLLVKEISSHWIYHYYFNVHQPCNPRKFWRGLETQNLSDAA